MHNLEKNINQLYDDQGKAWLAALPQMINNLSEKWDLTDLKPVSNLTYNYVLTGVQGKQAIILKLSFDASSLQHEIMALKAFAGFGVVKILAHEANALLLERALPGTTLTSYFPNKDTEAIHIACSAIERLHKAPLPNSEMHVPHISDWLKIIDQDWAGIPDIYLKQARKLKEKLLAEPIQSILLHGDLHQDNILKNNEEWLIIDPKGVMGPPLYDMAGCLIREPLDLFLKQPNQKDIINNRLKIISEYFNLDKTQPSPQQSSFRLSAKPLSNRSVYKIHEDCEMGAGNAKKSSNAKGILEWTFVQCIMSCCWSLEDNQDPGPCLSFVKMLDTILK